MKDPIPIALLSEVVHKFTRADCNTCYVDEITRHFGTRVREYLLLGRNFRMYQHLQNSESYKNLCSGSCFAILDSAHTSFQLKINIEWERPTLNKRLKHVNLTLVF